MRLRWMRAARSSCTLKAGTQLTGRAVLLNVCDAPAKPWRTRSLQLLGQRGSTDCSCHCKKNTDGGNCFGAIRRRRPPLYFVPCRPSGGKFLVTESHAKVIPAGLDPACSPEAFDVLPEYVNFRKADSTLRSSQAVPHPSTNRALRRLTSEVRRDPVHSTRYGRQQRNLFSKRQKLETQSEVVPEF